MEVGDFGGRNRVKVEMEKGGRGVVCFSCWFSWGCWVGLFIRRSRLLQLQDRFPDNDLGDSGEVDGVVVDLGVVILMILRLRILERILASDMVMGQQMAGDLDSGLVLLEELLLDIWPGTEGTDKSRRLREETLGLAVTMAALPALRDALQAQALLRGMRAQDLVPRQEGN